MPTALKLEVLMKVLQERGEERLAKLTGLDRAVVARCKKLLSFPRKFQDMMLHLDPTRRIRADFFIELYAVLHDRTVRAMPWFDRDWVTKRALEKYTAAKGIKSVTDFRKVKQQVRVAVEAKKVREISKKLREYFEKDELGIDHLEIPASSLRQNFVALEKRLTGVEDSLENLDVETVLGEEKFWRRIENLYLLLSKKLAQAGRRIPG
jgi:hypothetical protein